MRIRILFFVVFAMLSACQETNIEKPERPDNLLSENKMVEVLYDMALVSSAKGINKRLLENKGIKPDSFIYKKHNIDSVQFAKSNAYYSYDIKTYQTIYNRVKRRLEADKKTFNAVIQEEKRKRDSTLRANRKRDSITKAKRLNKAKESINATPSRSRKADTSFQLKRQ